MIDPLLMIHTLGFVGGSIMVRFPGHYVLSLDRSLMISTGTESMTGL